MKIDNKKPNDGIPGIPVRSDRSFDSTPKGDRKFKPSFSSELLLEKNRSNLVAKWHN